MLSLIAFSLFLALAGVGATAWLWSRDADDQGGPELGAMEAIASWIVVTTALSFAINWVLSPLHAIRAPFLLAASLALAIASVAYLRTQVRAAGPAYSLLKRLASSEVGLTARTALPIAVPLCLWAAFISVRGTITLGLSFDSLAYHLPRAIDIARTGGWRYLPVEDFRLAWFPANYEMLLADAIALTGSDAATPFLAIQQYLSAFILCVAWGERRWGRGPRAWFGALVWATTPLALLHSAALKNDVLTMIFTVSIALWGARWVRRGGTAPLVLVLVAAAMGVGTKPTGALALPAFFLAFASFGLFPRLRATFSTPRRVAVLVVGSAALLGLLGLAPLIAHVLHPHHPSDMGMTPTEMAALNIVPSYDGWNNLWRFPVLLWLRAFSNRSLTVMVPWTHLYSFWPKFEVYTADFGIPVSCLALLVPIGLAFAVYGRRAGVAEREREREHAAASLFLVVTTVMVVLIRYRIDGAFSSYPRYVFFLPLLVVDWGLLPLIERLPTPRAQTLAITGALGLQSLWSFGEGVAVAEGDGFEALEYVGFVLAHPDTRVLQLGYFPRASQVFDNAAGPGDSVLIDGDFGAWIYPAYGRDLTRPVEVAPLQPDERMRAVDRADWVVIDRFWAIVFGSPSLTDMSRWMKYSEKGRISARDLVFYNQMAHDRRFTFFYRDPKHAQVVFRRVAPR